MKKVRGKIVFRLDGIDSGRIVSLDCGHFMYLWVNKSLDKATSMIPDKPDALGWTFVYKDGDNYKYIAEDELKEKQSELPLLSLAIKYPINRFEDKLNINL